MGRTKKSNLTGRRSLKGRTFKIPGGKTTPESIFRVLDANLNRAREGLRVLEDTARFVWTDQSLFTSLRKARHALDQTTRSAYPHLVAGRESAQDMGRKMKEGKSRDWPGLVAANFRRVQEALRVLEEYGKVFSPHAAAQFKTIRYQIYVAEKKSLVILRRVPSVVVSKPDPVV